MNTRKAAIVVAENLAQKRDMKLLLRRAPKLGGIGIASRLEIFYLKYCGEKANTVEKRQITAKSELDEDDNGAISHVDDKEQKCERHRRRKAREEKLAPQEDDPDAIVKLGEGSLDDESEESSESDGDSDSKLQPYEMSDEDNDVRRGKFVAQLADLAINLRKGDKPDA
ncbi:unnamed protein product [Calypogeia fissa]